MRSQSALGRPVRALVAGITAVAVVFLTPGVSSALPTAEFTMSTATPATSAPVTFTFTGTCDVPPCSVVWTWFQDGGSSLGTRMGTGQQITYAFPRAGAYSVVAKITNATSTHGSASMTHVVTVGTKLQETDPGLRLGNWSTVATAGASQGRQHVGTGTAVLAFRNTTRLDYVARTGPDRGIARVTMDGLSLGTLDLYAPVAGSLTRSFTGLTTGVHTIRVSSTGTRNAASTSNAISVDEFVIGGAVHIDDVSVWIGYGGWLGRRVLGDDGGGDRHSASTGGKVAMAFTGTSVTWETATGPDQGVAQVVMDGVNLTTVDNYSASPVARVKRTFTVATGGRHVLQLVVTGQHRAASTGNQVVIDAFVY